MTDLEAILLSIVRDEGPCHGLDIGREAEQRSGRIVGAGSLYRALHRMEGAGFLTAYWEDRDTSESHRGPNRRYYQITGLGAIAVDEYLEQLAKTARGVGMRLRPA